MSSTSPAPEAENENPFRTFWDLGYERLVPVVPPGAELHPKSTIAARLRAGEDARGKVPGIRGEDDLWRGMRFVAIEAQEEDLGRWAAMGASVGVKTGQGLIAVDIDTTNRPAAEAIFKLAEQHLGKGKVRFGRKPKCLLLYEAPPETAYAQVRFSTETEDRALVEVLAEGRQFVAHGLHPATGQAYLWPLGVPARADLTHITAEQLRAFLTAVAATFKGEVRASGEVKDAPDQESLRAPSWDALERTVEGMENTTEAFPTRDAYIDVCYAIKGAAGEEHEHNARDLWLDWCSRWDEEQGNDLDVALADWNRAKPPFRIGYPWLLQHAPHMFFGDESSDDDGAEDDDMFAANAQAEQGKNTARFPLLTRKDIRRLPPPEWLIERHLPKTGFGILYGDPGTGKSFMALDMCLHLAYGLQRWHGDAIAPKDEPGPRNVLYIAGEGSAGFNARISAWEAHQGVLPAGDDGEAIEPAFNALFAPCNFMKPEDVTGLLASVASHGLKDLALVVVDTISRAIPGAEENLQKDMSLFIAACDAIRMRTGAFVLGVHHTSAAGRMRGSTVFAGGGDAILRFDRKKGATVGRLTCEKMKEAPDGWHETYRLETVSAGFHGGESEESVTSLVPVRTQGVGAEARSTGVEVQALVGEALKAAWEAGDPWSARGNGKRYAVREMVRDFGLKGDDAEALLGRWLEEGVVIDAVYDKRNRKMGLRWVGDVSDEMSGEDGSDGEGRGDVFG